MLSELVLLGLFFPVPSWGIGWKDVSKIPILCQVGHKRFDSCLNLTLQKNEFFCTCLYITVSEWHLDIFFSVAISLFQVTAICDIGFIHWIIM